MFSQQAALAVQIKLILVFSPGMSGNFPIRSSAAAFSRKNPHGFDLGRGAASAALLTCWKNMRSLKRLRMKENRQILSTKDEVRKARIFLEEKTEQIFNEFAKAKRRDIPLFGSQSLSLYRRLYPTVCVVPFAG